MNTALQLFINKFANFGFYYSGNHFRRNSQKRENFAPLLTVKISLVTTSADSVYWPNAGWKFLFKYQDSLRFGKKDGLQKIIIE